MNTAKKISSMRLAFMLCFLLGGIVYGAEVKGLTGSANAASFEVCYIPATEDIGAIALHLQLKAAINVTDVIAASPQTGAWSQICPAVSRFGNSITINSAAPTIMLSSDTSHVSMFTVTLKFSGLQKVPQSIGDFADSLWIEKAYATTGSPLTAILLNYSTASILHNPTTQPAGAKAADITNVGQRYTLSFNLAVRSLIIAQVVDAAGKNVQQITNKYFPPGIHTLSWDGRDKNGLQLPPGTYFIQLSTGSLTYNKKITCVR